MSYWKQTEITDIFGDLGMLTQNGELYTIEPYRTCGGVFTGSTINPYFYTATVSNGGTVTQGNSLQTLATNTTANGSAQVLSNSVCRYVGWAQCIATNRLALGDTGVANNVRRWGAFNGTDGAYFKISGTTVYVATMAGGSETAIASSSWNQNTTVPTLTNYNRYQILYSVNTVVFMINSVPVHIASFATGQWTYNLHLPVWMDNVNSAGSTTNVTMSSKSATIYRLGRRDTQDVCAHLTTAGTYNLKYSPGTLHRIVLNNPTGTLITVYDNITNSGTVLAVINTPAQANPVTLEYEIEFNIGLTIVTTGTWDLSVVYQ